MKSLVLLLASSVGLFAGSTITANNSGKCLDVQGQSKSAGALIQQWACWGGINQSWNLIQTSDSSYQIQSVNSGLAITVNGDLVSNGNTISQQVYTASLHQRWNLKTTTGGLEIVNEKSGKCLDVRGGSGSKANGVLLQQWTCWGGSNQLFTVHSAHSSALTWNASGSAGVSGYNIYRGTLTGGPYTQLTVSPVANLKYTDSSVLPGHTYFYVATAVGNGSESVYSNQVQATIPSP